MRLSRGPTPYLYSPCGYSNAEVKQARPSSNNFSSTTVKAFWYFPVDIFEDDIRCALTQTQQIVCLLKVLMNYPKQTLDYISIH
jgi:hypothetical protein